MEQTDCTRLFEAMEQAQRMYAYGSGSVQKAAARMLKNYLIVEESLLHVIEGREEREMALRTMQPGDVVFLYSVSGNNPQMNEYAAQMREKGMKLVAICQDGANALVKLCEFKLPFYTQKFEIGRYAIPYHSSAGMFVISEILALKYAVYRAAKGCDWMICTAFVDGKIHEIILKNIENVKKAWVLTIQAFSIVDGYGSARNDNMLRD